MTWGNRLLRSALALVMGGAALVGVPALTAGASAVPAARVLLVDSDGDGIDDAVDGCPTVASSNPTGCPSASRKVALKWLGAKKRLQVRVSSPVGGCQQRARFAVFRVRPNKDFKVFGGSVSFSGRLRIKVPRGSTYYVTVPQSYASGIAECGKAESRRVLAPRG